MEDVLLGASELTVEQIREVLYQCVPYCGLPACVESFRGGEEVLKEIGLLGE